MKPPSCLAEFDSIRIVNLPTRTDRRREMQQQLRMIGLADDTRVAFFDALAFDNPGPFLRTGSNGAFHSHLALLEQAALADQSILILQDDCDFILPAIFTYAIPDTCDIFYGGYNASNPIDLHGSDIIGAHFMGFSRRAVHVACDYLRRYLAPDFTPDAKASTDPGYDPAIRPPIDGALVWLRRAHPDLVTIFAMLGRQRASRTDIGDKRIFDKIPFIRDAAQAARSIARLRRGRADQA